MSFEKLEHLMCKHWQPGWDSTHVQKLADFIELPSRQRITVHAKPHQTTKWHKLEESTGYDKYI